MDKAKIKNAVKSATDTADCLIGPGCIYQIPAIFKMHFPNAKAVVVADDNTFEAAGKVVNDHLKSGGFDVLNPFVFPGRPMLHADYRHVETLREFLIKHDTIAVAVGSGTINDIVKLASQESGRKYIVAPTAASVDGYSAFGASISVNGLKQTLECPAPLVIVADTQVLQKAPPEMNSAETPQVPCISGVNLNDTSDVFPAFRLTVFFPISLVSPEANDFNLKIISSR